MNTNRRSAIARKQLAALVLVMIAALPVAAAGRQREWWREWSPRHVVAKMKHFFGGATSFGDVPIPPRP